MVARPPTVPDAPKLTRRPHVPQPVLVPPRSTRPTAPFTTGVVASEKQPSSSRRSVVMNDAVSKVLPTDGAARSTQQRPAILASPAPPSAGYELPTITPILSKGDIIVSAVSTGSPIFSAMQSRQHVILDFHASIVKPDVKKPAALPTLLPLELHLISKTSPSGNAAQQPDSDSGDLSLAVVPQFAIAGGLTLQFNRHCPITISGFVTSFIPHLFGACDRWLCG